MNATEILNVLHTLQATKSNNDKVLILGEYLNDPDFLNVIKFTCDARLHYNISELSEYGGRNIPTPITDVFKYLTYLSSKRGTSATERIELEELACSNQSLHELTNRILSKNLKCGVGAATINKALPNTVEVFPYMRCSTVSKLSRMTYPALVQEKLDGEYITVLVERNKPIAYRTRYGNFLDFAGEFDSNFIDTNTDVDFALCGEVLVRGDDGEYLGREASNGIISKAQTGTLSAAEAKRIVIVLWDMVQIDEFHGRSKCPLTKYHTRFNQLKTYLTSIDAERVMLVDYEIVDTESMAYAYFERLLLDGKEGAVVKDDTNVFKNHTSPTAVKLKPIKECELRLVRWNYGKPDSKFRYCVGSITCQTDDGLIVVDIGSGTGFNYKSRGFLGFDDAGIPIHGMDTVVEEFWNNSIGGIVATEFSYVSKAKGRDEVDSLYLPTYKHIRTDKLDADTADYVNSL